MVMTTDDNSGFWSSNDFFAVDEDWGDLSLDIDALNAILEEDSDPTTEQSQLVLQSNPEDLSCHSFQAEQTKGDVRDSQSQNGIRESEELFPVGPVLPDSSLWCPSECLQPSFPMTGVDSECLSGSPDFGGMIFDYGKFDISPRVDSPVHSCSASLTDWLQTSHTEHDIWSGEKIGSSTLYSNIDGKKILQRTPNCPVLSFSPVDANQAPNCIDYMSLSHVKNENSTEFGHVEGDLHFRCPSQFTKMEDSGASPSEFALMDAHISLTNPPHSDVGDEVSGIKYEAGSFLPASFCGLPSVISDNGTFGDPSADADDGFLTDDASRRSFSSIQSSSLTKKKVESVEGGRLSKLYALAGIIDKASKGFCSPVGITSPCSGVSDGPSAYHASSLLSSGVQSSTSSKRETIIITDEECSLLFPPSSMISHSIKFADKVIHGSTSTTKISIDDDDDDADICILEDISDPIHPSPYIVHGKSLVTAHQPGFSDSFHSGMEGTRLKVNDERLTFRAAMQDLSQPKSESSLPDGCLDVPLLRHQRIALSWMVQKETASLHCSGGILADDQGLGKTISTIALILKERSPSYNLSTMAIKEEESQALNLDDDEGFLDHDGTKQDGISGHVTVRKNLKKSESGFVLAKGRPAAGTLVVCPTSVLRQWAEELQTKVKEEANLSVLVYHGSNRTKDPCELAKYDVVITTYSIVSMEVPKQPLVDKDDEEKRKQQSDGLSSMGLSSSRKRKYPTSEKKKRKNKKGLDSALLEAGARPLARVGWFRVVLDEAQSIKNYRTQVARACWGLRAKRRWCLSGTPIQNSIDDLYSYFRFLRYDPYAVYTSFCSTIKIPISKNPTSGYRKLQAILKTIMLRRTKATVIDGEPIINLPPKTIKLKKVNFSDEERDFYSQLEADSRAQFKVYAAAGTVKQNYVNILLMLLRLRQACDHPLLVKGYDSSSVWSSSLEVAKKLPREKQMDLLNCLEGFLAICGICNDPPEDAVVTICGHVFCNQCICERLSGDDTLCPSAQCRVQLSVTSVFSKATLRHSLSDQPGHDSSVGKFDPQLAGALEPSSTGVSDSSKIKAAIEVLKALSEPGNRPLKDSSLKSGNLVVSDSHIGESCKDMAGEKVVDVEKCRKDSITKAPEKAIVFSQWTRMLDLLEARLKSSGIHYRRLDGTMSVLARDKAVKDFNTLPEVTVIIMSLKAASLGLNMVAACHVLLLDLWWNPTTEDQAVDRAHRIGQTRPVSVLRLTVKDTVEDRILALQEKKRQMVSSAFGEDEDGGRQTRLTVDDLEYLFMA